MAGRDVNPYGFGLFKVHVADQLTDLDIRKLATYFAFPPAFKGDGLDFVNTLVRRGIIKETDISELLNALNKVALYGIQEDLQKTFKRPRVEQVSSPLKPSPTPEEGEPPETITIAQVPSPLKPSLTLEGGEPSKTTTDEAQVPSPLKPSLTLEGGEPSKTTTDEQVPSSLKPSSTPEGGEPLKKSTDEEQVPSSLKPSPTPEGGEPLKTSIDEEQVPSSLKPSPTPEGGEPLKKSTDDDTKPVFISFSSKDKTKVEEIVATFEEALGPKTCWMYTTGIQGGQNIDREIVRAVDKAEVVICMISQNYIDSDECVKEAMLAEQSRKKMIAVHIDSVRTPYKCKDGAVSALQLRFARISHIKLTGKDMKNEQRSLIVTIKKLISHEDNQFTEEQVPSPLKPSPTPEGGEPSKTSTNEQAPSPVKPSLTPEGGEPSKTSTDEQVPSPLKPSPTPEGGEPSKTSTNEQVPSPLKPSPTPEGGEPSKTSTDGKFSTGKRQGKSCLTAATETRDSKVNPYFCAYCQIIFEESWQHQYHTETEKHKGNINIKKDDEKWAYGEPPLGITDGKFELCPKQSEKCSGCSHAQSPEELDEWNKRHDYRLEAVYNYQLLPSEDMTDQTSKLKKLVEMYEEEKQKDGKLIENVGNISYLSASDQIIAKGSQGALIFVGKYKDEYVAVKRTQTIQSEEDLCNMMQDKDVNNVVKIVCIEKKNLLYYVVTPLCECDLESFIKASSSLSQLQQIKLCLDILNGLMSLHSLGIVHRDLKPNNVLINKKGEALLTDFGISRICIGASTAVTAVMGSLLWLPSECIAGIKEKRFSKASDIQTAGYLVYYILSNGHHPFEASDPNDTVLLQDNIKKGMFQLLHLGNFPENCKSLLTKMLDKEVKNRPGIEDCLQEMKEVKSLLIQQLSEEIQPSLPGVEVLCGKWSIDMTSDRNSKQTWSFRVKSGKNLQKISFRHIYNRELFFFPPRESQPRPKELFAEDLKADTEGYACFEVHFQANGDTGLFDQQMIFDFGEKPFLCQQLLVWIDPKSPIQ